MANGATCRFCEIAAGDPDEHVLLADDRTVAFLDKEPVHPGHSLVIPRDHWAGLPEISDGAVRALYSTVRRVAVAIDRTVDPEGINAIHSSGSAAGQDVHHAHVHVIPRYQEDRFGFDPPRRRYDDGEADALTARLRESLPP